MRKEKTPLPHAEFWPEILITIIRPNPQTGEVEFKSDEDGNRWPVRHVVKGVGVFGMLSFVDAEGVQVAGPLMGIFLESADGIYFLVPGTKPWRVSEMIEEIDDFGPPRFSARTRVDDQVDVVVSDIWLGT